jgi:hypothetical protein
MCVSEVTYKRDQYYVSDVFLGSPSIASNTKKNVTFNILH